MSSLPAAAEAAFYAHGPEGQQGPMTADQLIETVAAGHLPEDVPVWWPTAEGWVPLSAQPELAGRLAARRGGAAAPLAPAPAAGPSDEQQDAIFAQLVKDSWAYHHLVENTQKVDEILVGALITSTLDTGYALIDLTSDGNNHYLRFESLEDRSRISMGITHLTRSAVQAKTLGQRASVVIGYGEPVQNFGRVWNAIKAEAKSGYLTGAEPGTVTVDADLAAGYLYMQVELTWKLENYIGEDLSIDYATLSQHVDAVVHALKKFLAGRIG